MKAGWEELTFGDIAIVDWGNTSLTKKSYVSNGPYLGVSAAGCDGRMEHSEHKRHTPVLSAIGAQCGRMFLPDEDFTAIKNTITLTPIENLVETVFLYYLLTFVELPQRGAGQPFISKGDIQKFAISLPPLDEQKRIVAVLDAAFDGLTRARANVEANLQNARELFESELKSSIIFDNSSKGWVKKKFVDVCILQRGFDLPKRLRVKGEYGLVTSSGVTDSHNEYKVIGPGVATGRSGSIGNVFYVENDFWPLNTALYIKDFKGNVPKFIWYFLRSFDLSRFSSGAGVPTLNRNHVHDEIVILPDNSEEQKRVINKLEIIEAKTKELEAHYKSKLADLDELRQSLLQKAFAGELT